MSQYEDYTRVAHAYDATRLPVGVERIVARLAESGTPPEAMTLLDAGCGTGAYAAALEGRIGRIVALDANAAMLAAARRKCGARVALLRGSITALPVRDAAFDAIMNILVLHHLPTADESGAFAAMRRAIGEFARALRPGGVLIVGLCRREQLRSGYWYSSLIPRAIAACCAATPPTALLASVLAESGFAVGEAIVPRDETLQGAAYFNPRGPLDAGWRDGDSVWSLAPPEELRAACAKIRRLDAAGALDAYLRDRDARRREIGQITFFCATRR